MKIFCHDLYANCTLKLDIINKIFDLNINSYGNALRIYYFDINN